MPAISFAALVNLTKYQYPFGLESAAYMTSPLLGRMPKGKLVGTAVSAKIKHSPGNKASSTFATIQNNFGASTVSEFLVSNHYYNYAVFQLETAAIARSEGNAAGVRSYVKTETDSALEDLGGQLAEALYGNGGGAIGQIASGGGTSTLTLTTLEDIIHFEVGQRVDVSIDDGTGGAGLVGDVEVITAIDRDLGTITQSGTWSGVNYAANRYLFREGNYGNQASGLESWNPHQDTSVAATFRNVNRAVDRVRLAGNTYESSGDDGTYLRCFSNALSKTERSVKGARPTELFVNPYVFDRTVQEMNDRTEYVKMPGRSMGQAESVNFGYKAIKISVGDAECMMYKDIWCPRDVGRLLQLDTWEILAVPGGFPRMLEGGSGRTVEAADASEFRYAAYWDTLCRNPGKNCRIDLSYLNSL
jgi:hypothetical protein